ncbi:hypothetical protein CHH28_10470 [Bacterioplanes sanyensis]|uniref:DUF3592 domain-containing protein n=1 Tax=Bacterioplanes sanyensis TaxID=1249553 RepID=A0A222FJ61_9GAMM|nr:hypothetical protein [Bacterioplanes sanyensis]ASP39077.1 hypothetical protein CHH28_10470 [Bacterioplanes sanyensis]
MNTQRLIYAFVNPLIGKYLKIPAYIALCLFVLPALLIAVLQVISDISVSNKEWLPVPLEATYGQPQRGDFSYKYQFDGETYRNRQMQAGFITRSSETEALQRAYEQDALTVFINAERPEESALSLYTDVEGSLMSVLILSLTAALLFGLARMLGRKPPDGLASVDIMQDQASPQDKKEQNDGVSSVERHTLKKRMLVRLVVFIGVLIYFSRMLLNAENWHSPWIALPLAIIGLLLFQFCQAAIPWWRFRKIGQTPLSFAQPLDVQTGIDASYTVQGELLGQMTATLRCVASEQRDPGNRPLSSREVGLWQEQRLCQAEVLPSGDTRLTCQFEPPKDSPASFTYVASGEVYWQLHCRGMVRINGRDTPFERRWTLTVANSSASQPPTLMDLMAILQGKKPDRAFAALFDAAGQSSRTEAVVESTLDRKLESAADNPAQGTVEGIAAAKLAGTTQPKANLQEPESGDASSEQSSETITTTDSETVISDTTSSTKANTAAADASSEPIKDNAEYARASAQRWVDIDQQQDTLRLLNRRKRSDALVLPFLLLPITLIVTQLYRGSQQPAGIDWQLIGFIALFGGGMAAMWILRSARKYSLTVKRGEMLLSTYWFGFLASQQTISAEQCPDLMILEDGRYGSEENTTIDFKICIFYQGKYLSLLRRIGSYQDALWISNVITEQLTGEALYKESAETSLAGQSTQSMYTRALSHHHVDLEQALTSNLTLHNLTGRLELVAQSRRAQWTEVAIVVGMLLVFFLFGGWVLGLFLTMPAIFIVAAMLVGGRHVCEIRTSKIDTYYSILGFRLQHTTHVLAHGHCVEYELKPIDGIQSDIAYVTFSLQQPNLRIELLSGYATQEEAKAIAERIDNSMRLWKR